ncbi:MAG: hypothetical protein IJJ04_01640 [Clostridia bacterium]|nr:hypothetical protein [Clostridia bacterium]
MFYNSMYEEYCKQAETLRVHIKILKTQYVKATTFEKEKINYRISVLYPMYLDLLHTAQYLKRKSEV